MRSLFSILTLIIHRIDRLGANREGPCQIRIWCCEEDGTKHTMGLSGNFTKPYLDLISIFQSRRR